MRRKMEKQIGLRLADPAFALIEDLANADERSTTEVARRLLLERLAEIADQRQRQSAGASTAATDTTGAAA